MADLFSLQGKNILITGASSGIGKQTAIDVSAAGAVVIITGRDTIRLHNTYKQLHGENHMLLPFDLCEFDQLNTFVEQIPLLNGIVHAAGITSHLPAKFIAQADIVQLMQINYMAPVLLNAALLRKKKISENSSIVFLSSIATKYPYYGGALYSATKAAIEAYSRTLALELASKKIRSNCISPSFVNTEMVEEAGKTISTEVLEKFEKMMPLGFGKTTDVSAAIIYLLSNASQWVTGSNITLGGG